VCGLDEKIQLLANVVESSDDAIISKSLDGVITSWNKSAELIYGCSAEEIIGKNISILAPPQLEDEVNQLINKIKDGEKVFHYETIRIRKNSKQINVSITMSPIFDNIGNLIGISTIARDITKRKKSEKLLENSYITVRKQAAEILAVNISLKAEIKEHKRMDQIIRDNILRMNIALESADMGAWDLDLVNDTSIRTLDHDRIFGYDSLLPEWGTKTFFEQILPEDREYVQQRFEKSYETNKLYFQCRIVRADKEIRWIELYGNVYKDKKDVPIRILGVVSDITERKESETHLLRAIDEKEMLLREIHHRVKNNMQIISSFLSLQSSQVFDNRDASLFTNVQDRVKSMALIHDNLYKSEDLSSIQFKEYVQTLISQLFATHSELSKNIKLVTDIFDVTFNMETAIPLGLIISEIVTNSLKHAFPDSKGKISISLHTKGEETELIVKDNGVGVPKDFDIKKPEKLGLQLLNTLVEQLEGTIKLDRNHGTEFKITFKELKYKERI
jgi:PAS domain S-box-containing protein